MSLLAQTYHKDVKYILNNKTHVKTVWHGNVKIWPMAKFYILNSGEEELEYTVEDIPSMEYESVLATSVKLRSQKSDVVLPFYYTCSEGIALTGSFNAPNAAVTPSITNLSKYGASGYIDSNPTRSASSEVIPDIILKWKVKGSAIKGLYIEFAYPGRDYTLNADEKSSISSQMTNVNINVYSDSARTKLITSTVAEAVQVTGYATNTTKINLAAFTKKIELEQSDTLKVGDTVYCSISFNVTQKDRTFTVTPTQTSGSGSYTEDNGIVNYTWWINSPKSGDDYSWQEATLVATTGKTIEIGISAQGTPNEGYIVTGSPATGEEQYTKLPVTWNANPTVTDSTVKHFGSVTLSPSTSIEEALKEKISFVKTGYPVYYSLKVISPTGANFEGAADFSAPPGTASQGLPALYYESRIIIKVNGNEVVNVPFYYTSTAGATYEHPVYPGHYCVVESASCNNLALEGTVEGEFVVDEKTDTITYEIQTGTMQSCGGYGTSVMEGYVELRALTSAFKLTLTKTW